MNKLLDTSFRQLPYLPETTRIRLRRDHPPFGIFFFPSSFISKAAHPFNFLTVFSAAAASDETSVETWDTPFAGIGWVCFLK